MPGLRRIVHNALLDRPHFDLYNRTIFTNPLVTKIGRQHSSGGEGISNKSRFVCPKYFLDL